MSQRFEVVNTNPNQTTGGGGCLCSEVENPDCKGPFAVFHHQEMESNLSPHAVLCLDCAKAVVEVAAIGEPLSGGEAVGGELLEPELDETVYEGVTHPHVTAAVIREDGEVEEIPEV